MEKFEQCVSHVLFPNMIRSDLSKNFSQHFGNIINHSIRYSMKWAL